MDSAKIVNFKTQSYLEQFDTFGYHNTQYWKTCLLKYSMGNCVSVQTLFWGTVHAYQVLVALCLAENGLIAHKGQA